MRVEAEVLINADRDVVWRLVSDIENAEKTITGIEKIEILEKPETGLVGLKWRETRTLFGKTATEVMWITAAEQPVVLRDRGAESWLGLPVTRGSGRAGRQDPTCYDLRRRGQALTPLTCGNHQVNYG